MKLSKDAIRSWHAGVLGGLLIMSFMLSSCIKNNDADVAPPTALMTVIQASPDEPALDFYLNSSKVNQVPLTYGTGIDYFSAIAGNRTANFYNSGTFGSPVVTAPVTLQPNMAYSLFMDNVPANPGILLLTDTLLKPPGGKAGVRFVDLSPDAPAVDLAIQGGATVTSNKLFSGYTSFISVPAQSNFTFQVLKSGTSTVLATLPNVTLVSGYLYTVMLEGLNTPTNSTDALTVEMINNAYFN
jgi:hypothetical protein